MTQTIDPRVLYSQSSFFLDFIEGKGKATSFFAHSISSVRRLADARRSLPDRHTRAAVCDALLGYNRMLNASSGTLDNIERLQNGTALCVIGGQQAEFLGGPLFILYKIASIVRTAAWLSDSLDVPVLPMFWLASEDHDFAEINHTRWLDDSGTLRTVSFDWEGQGRPIERLPMTQSVQGAFREVNLKLPFLNASDAALFVPTADDNYCTWHARIWSRLFAEYGLILVEPRVLRFAAGPFYARALNGVRDIQADLRQGASRLEKHGYPVPLDADSAGTLFTFDDDGIRRRIDDSSSETALTDPTAYSVDAAVRPLLADSLLPTIANILGPSELAYHAMLGPLYERWNIPQPLAIPRQGATIIPRAGYELLHELGIEIGEALRPEFSPNGIVKRFASEKLSLEFSEARARLEAALSPLKARLSQLDPGLELRWRQTVDQVLHQLERLEDRATRAELSRRGVSVRSLQSLKPMLLPMEKPQERILSAFSFIARYGVEWIRELVARGEPDRFEHQLIVLEESS